jgi:acetyltransferase-like isoleucine patch superfamily enzyme
MRLPNQRFSSVNSARVLGRSLAWLRSRPGLLWRAEAVFKGVACGKDVVFLGRPLISVAPDSRLILSDGVHINSALRSNPLGCFQPSVLRTLAPGAELRLAPRVGISAAILCAGKQITIGEDTIIGAGAMLIDNDFHALLSDGTWKAEYVEGARPIRIGRSVFIGARAIILKGVEIGDAAIIGAGAVVTRDVPPATIFAGNPAREIGKRCSPLTV